MNAMEFMALRRKLGLTQQQFGEKLKFAHPQPRISEIERGKQPVSPHVAALCEYIEREWEGDFEKPKKKAVGS